MTKARHLLIFSLEGRGIAAMAITGVISIVLTFGSALGQAVEKWDAVIAAAKKEGKVVVYGVSNSKPMIDEIKSLFSEKYGLRIEYLTGRSREVRERVNTEVRTRRQIVDVANAGATSLPALWQDGGLETWLPPSLKVVRADILEAYDVPAIPITPLYLNPRGILINTNLVKPGEEPKSWKDLADPRWKGKLITDDPRSAGAGNSFFVSTMRHPDLGKEFHGKLSRNKPVFLGAGDYQQIGTRVAQGEYAVAFPVDASDIVQLKGSPVKYITPVEGVTYTIQGAGLVKNAPRPNAAKLLIDFMLSVEFQRVAGKSSAPVRTGIKAADEAWALENMKLLPRPLAETREEREKFYRLAESIYGIR